jgi:hypothetical protein
MNSDGFEKKGSGRKNFPVYPMKQHFRKASGRVAQAQRFVFSGSPDLVSSKLLDPPAHSLVSFPLEM